jgi:hypothetical protein
MHVQFLRAGFDGRSGVTRQLADRAGHRAVEDLVAISVQARLQHKGVLPTILVIGTGSH